MNRAIGKFLVLGVVGLALSFGGSSTAKAQWSWWDGGYYNYGAGYSPSAYGYGYYPYSTSYWPSSYYVGYGSYSMYPSYAAWPGCGCGSSCYGGSCGGSCCGTSLCGSACGGGCSSCGTSGCCGLASCGSCCGSSCGSGCGLACGPSCGTGCGTPGCGATNLPPGTKAKPIPEEGFQARPSPTYDDTAPRPGSTERTPRSSSPSANGLGGPPPAGDPDAGTQPYSRNRSGDGGTKQPAAQTPPKDFEAPVGKSPAPTTPPAGGPKDAEPFETKKPLVPIQSRGADKKAPISTPDDPADAVTPTFKPKTDAKKPSAENRTDEQPQKGRSALTLQDRSTWHLTGISRPLFGQIAQSTAPLPERLSPSTGDWAVFSADEAQVARR